VASKSDNLNIIFGWRHTKFTCGNKQSGLKPKVTGVSRRFSKKKYSLMPWSRSPSFLHAVQVRRWIYLGLVLVGFGRFRWISLSRSSILDTSWGPHEELGGGIGDDIQSSRIFDVLVEDEVVVAGARWWPALCPMMCIT
jgi:hypothetical protein